MGRCGQTEEQLAQNVLSAVDSLRHKFPGGWANIRSLHLKLDKSPAVPIHVSDGTQQPSGARGQCGRVGSQWAPYGAGDATSRWLCLARPSATHVAHWVFCCLAFSMLFRCRFLIH